MTDRTPPPHQTPYGLVREIYRPPPGPPAPVDPPAPGLAADLLVGAGRGLLVGAAVLGGLRLLAPLIW
jgi:hypothetical protein